MALHKFFDAPSFPGTAGTSLASIEPAHSDDSPPSWFTTAFTAVGDGTVTSTASGSADGLMHLPATGNGAYDLDLTFDFADVNGLVGIYVYYHSGVVAYPIQLNRSNLKMSISRIGVGGPIDFDPPRDFVAASPTVVHLEVRPTGTTQVVIQGTVNGVEFDPVVDDDPAPGFDPAVATGTTLIDYNGGTVWRSLTLTDPNATDPDPPAATTLTLTSPGSAILGDDVAVSVAPDASATAGCTVTPGGSAAAGLSAQTLTWTAETSAKTASFTPTVAGTLTLTLAVTSGGLTATGSPDSVTIIDPAGLVPYLTAVPEGIFAPELVGTPGFGYCVSDDAGQTFGGLIAAGIGEPVPGYYAAYALAPPGATPLVKWSDGSGQDVVDAAPASPGSGGAGARRVQAPVI